MLKYVAVHDSRIKLVRYDLIGFDGFQDENLSLEWTSSMHIVKLNITSIAPDQIFSCIKWICAS